jgi:hypothetical protein
MAKKKTEVAAPDPRQLELPKDWQPPPQMTPTELARANKVAKAHPTLVPTPGFLKSEASPEMADTSQANPLGPPPGARPDFIKDKKKVEKEFAPGATPEDEPRMIQLARKLMEQKTKKTEAAAAETAANKEIDSIETELTALMETEKIDLFRVGKLGTFSINPHNYPTVTSDVDLIRWLDDNGMGAIAKRTVHYQTLKGLVNELTKENKPIPDGVTNFVKPRVHTVKAKS